MTDKNPCKDKYYNKEHSLDKINETVIIDVKILFATSKCRVCNIICLGVGVEVDADCLCYVGQSFPSM